MRKICLNASTLSRRSKSAALRDINYYGATALWQYTTFVTTKKESLSKRLSIAKKSCKKGARDFAEKPYVDGASICFIRSTTF
jgi:hypothetical protein